MARTIGDLALFLDTQAHRSAIDPLSIPAPTTAFVDAVRKPRAPKRIAYTPDLGIAPVDIEIADICATAARKFEQSGAIIDEATINLQGAEETFQTLRAAQFAAQFNQLLVENRHQLKPEVIWNIEKGQELTAAQINEAELARGALYNRTTAFFEVYDLLLSPAVLVPPFPIDERYVAEAGGRKFDNYVSWLMMSFALTLTACPSISIPCGFTSSGLPVGLQITAPHADEITLISAAALLERELNLKPCTPIDPIVRHDASAKS